MDLHVGTGEVVDPGLAEEGTQIRSVRTCFKHADIRIRRICTDRFRSSESGNPAADDQIFHFHGYSAFLS